MYHHNVIYIGFIFIIFGLVLNILWQQGLVQLQPIQCPKWDKIPIAYKVIDVLDELA
mgnify:CR=1 FL=1